MTALEKLPLVKQGNYCSTSSLLDFASFKENDKLITIDHQQRALNADPKAIHQLNFNTLNLWNVLGIQQCCLLSKNSKKLC